MAATHMLYLYSINEDSICTCTMRWRSVMMNVGTSAPAAQGRPGRGVIENNDSTDGQIAINRQIDVRELRVNAHTMVCGRSAITNRVRSSV